MRKAQKREVLGLIKSLYQAHEEIRNALAGKNYILAQNMLVECQEFAIEFGSIIEKLEGEEHVTVTYTEVYCEKLFCAYKEIQDLLMSKSCVNEGRIYKILNKQLIKIENSVKNDIRVKIEIAFFPYKASMWDSLESIYLATKADPDCDAYCVPIPYYDLNSNQSLGKMHYEGDKYPENINVVDWKEYCFEERKPDVVYIHNPYDQYNLVTSVHPRFYSSNLKKYTDILVYVPYYSTSGGMSKAQSLFPAYIYADYIVIQSPKFRKYFDDDIPNQKFLPFGSPKFDKIIKKCQNPPEPMKEWKEKIAGRKVYFYNTSIAGMLDDTESFLKKMNYVFQCFEGRETDCLLWRPHPLLEATLDSMRPQYRLTYDALKQRFLDKSLGILDTTPDIADTIALCDAYIGDAGTSITSLFSMAGKPIFILNNKLQQMMGEKDWRKENINLVFHGDDRYQITGNNQLWFSKNNDYHYRFYLDLGTEFYGEQYYMNAIEIKGKIYIVPRNTQHFLIIEDKKIRKIELKNENKSKDAFGAYRYYSDYIYLFPKQYPYVVRLNVITETVEYIDGIKEFNVKIIDGELQMGGISSYPYQNEFVIASPEDNCLLFLDINTLQTHLIDSGIKSNAGISSIILDGGTLWLMPNKGMNIICWNPMTGELNEYGDLPDDFRINEKDKCNQRPFNTVVFSRENGKESIIISPCWGNMHLSLDKSTGELKEWKLPMKCNDGKVDENSPKFVMGSFLGRVSQWGKSNQMWYACNKRLYDINIDTKEYKEIEIEFDYEDLKAHEPGFASELNTMPYCLKESQFNSLSNFLAGDIAGEEFDSKLQLEYFLKINANITGSCGMNIHSFIKEKALN